MLTCDKPKRGRTQKLPPDRTTGGGTQNNISKQ